MLPQILIEGFYMTSRAEAYALYSGGYAFVDGVEDVTFTPANPAGSATTGVKALRGDLQRDALQGAVVMVEPATVVFTLWDATLSGNTPRGGDLITDAASNGYRVVSVVRQVWDTQWKCVCQPEV